jgi:hypothetical protein
MISAISFVETNVVISPVAWRQVAGIAGLLVMGVLFGVFVYFAVRRR